MGEHSLQRPTHRAEHSQRKSAVMLLIVERQNQAHLLLCKRSANLRHHPSQICLPGGKQEHADKNLQHTALRELHEELSIPSHQIKIEGELPTVATLGNMQITPFVASAKADTVWRADQSEIAHAFLTPISDLANKSNWQTMAVKSKQKNTHFSFFPTPHGLLWGATERIIATFITQLQLKP